MIKEIKILNNSFAKYTKNEKCLYINDIQCHNLISEIEFDKFPLFNVCLKFESNRFVITRGKHIAILLKDSNLETVSIEENLFIKSYTILKNYRSRKDFLNCYKFDNYLIIFLKKNQWYFSKINNKNSYLVFNPEKIIEVTKFDIDFDVLFFSEKERNKLKKLLEGEQK